MLVLVLVMQVRLLVPWLLVRPLLCWALKVVALLLWWSLLEL